ncbi:MAG: transcription termination factor NusA [Candidatus Pacebacteria bacterium]|nr:transcription termination factor NusA [Candidatus Paceibacterota bacterium]
MLDLKALNTTLAQLEDERNIPKEKIIEAIEQALAAAYKKDYGKRGQIVRAQFNLDDGTTAFEQVKTVVDESLVYVIPEESEEESVPSATASHERAGPGEEPEERAEDDERTRFNPEQHIMIEDARRMKNDASLGEEIIFPLEVKDDFGRIAAQTAKQVIIQRIREAERDVVVQEFSGREGEIISGIVQRVDRGNIYIDINRAVAVLPREEQIPGEIFRVGSRIRAYLYQVEEGARGVSLKLSRSHPRFVEALFSLESPEVASGIVEIKAIAREAGSRTKIAVFTNDDNIDPIGACVGQKGIRVVTVMGELGNEKIDIIPWSENASEFISSALSPARVIDIQLNEEDRTAHIEVAEDQLSLAIGKGGQNVRLAAKLTEWRIDIKGTESPEESNNAEETLEEGIVDDGTTDEPTVDAESQEEVSVDDVTESEAEEKIAASESNTEETN